MTCPGMKQWGTVDRAKEGKSAWKFCGITMAAGCSWSPPTTLRPFRKATPAAPCAAAALAPRSTCCKNSSPALPRTYPSFGKPAITGTFDEATENSVKKFQKQFSLTVDGVVGKATWYKISYIYVSVKDLAELTSEGETFTGARAPGRGREPCCAAAVPGEAWSRCSSGCPAWRSLIPICRPSVWMAALARPRNARSRHSRNRRV